MLVKSLVKAAFRGELLFRSSRPDFIETDKLENFKRIRVGLFRSSRPDFIETYTQRASSPTTGDCSGLPGRTSLRRLAVQRKILTLLDIVPVFQAGLH